MRPDAQLGFRLPRLMNDPAGADAGGVFVLPTNSTTVIARESGRSNDPLTRLYWTGCPAFAGHDDRGSWVSPYPCPAPTFLTSFTSANLTSGARSAV